MIRNGSKRRTSRRSSQRITSNGNGSDENSRYDVYSPANSPIGIGKPPIYIDPEEGLRLPIGYKRGERAKKFAIFVVVCLVAGYSLISYQERKFMKAQLLEQETKMREIEMDLSMKFDTQISNLKNENAALHRKVSEDQEFRIQAHNVNEHNHALEKQLHNLREEIKSVMSKSEMEARSKSQTRINIQRTSKEAVMAKFGKGPHRLEIFIRFDSHLGHDDGGIITIEMAPIDEMPHTVHWFLEQVDRKLYDGFSFHRNAGHVIQAGANHKNFLNFEHVPTEQGFKKAGFHSLLFQEYSENFPHRKYTLGFAGRPGGPEFYINTRDNTKNHGPGGQANHDVPSDADTCFAKIVDGFDLVDRMYHLPVKEGHYRSLKDNVAIVSIRRKV